MLKLFCCPLIGEEGEVDQAAQLMDEVERLKGEKDEKDRELKAMHKSSNQQQKLRVCEVCGANLSVYDSDRRLADHFGVHLVGFFATVKTVT